MATVYEIEIQATSAWVSFPEKYIKEKVEKFLEDKEGLKMENIQVKVKRIA